MQVGQAQIVRSHYLDRALSRPEVTFNGSYGNHIETLRRTYTVPANRILHIGSIQMQIYVQTAPSAAGLTELYINANEGAIRHGVWKMNDFGLAAVFQTAYRDIPVDLYLPAGTVIEIRTRSLATGGVFQFLGFVQCNEYNA